MSDVLKLTDACTGAAIEIPAHRVTEVRAPQVGAVLRLWTGSTVYVRETVAQVERQRGASK